jgi:hypothetical protein
MGLRPAKRQRFLKTKRAFPLADEPQERLGFRIARAEFQCLVESGSRAHQIGLKLQMLETREWGPSVQRPQAPDAFGDRGCFIEHFELMIFRGQKIEP